MKNINDNFIENLTIKELFKLRSNMIKEGKSITEINYIIEKKEREYTKNLFEDTCATGSPSGAVSGGDVGSIGMGAVTSAQPSSLAGATFGGDWSGHGGTIGSGDIGARGPAFQQPEMGMSHGPRTGKKSRKKRMSMKTLKNIFSKKQDYTTQTTTARTKKVMSFDDFDKQNINRVTKIKEI